LKNAMMPSSIIVFLPVVSIYLRQLNCIRE
jgi:hypothetical protein